jgi:hypothetical protein
MAFFIYLSLLRYVIDIHLQPETSTDAFISSQGSVSSPAFVCAGQVFTSADGDFASAKEAVTLVAFARFS